MDWARTESIIGTDFEKYIIKHKTHIVPVNHAMEIHGGSAGTAQAEDLAERRARRLRSCRWNAKCTSELAN